MFRLPTVVPYIRVIDLTNRTKAVNGLTSLGYVRKEQIAEDKRSERLYLTEKGQLLKIRIMSTVLEITNIMTRNLSSEEVEQVNYLLKTILNGLIEEKNRLIKADIL